MSPNLVSVLAAAESLPVAERRELVDLLLAGLDDAPPEQDREPPTLSEAWRQEIARRSAEYDAGRADTVAWQEVLALAVAEAFRWLAYGCCAGPKRTWRRRPPGIKPRVPRRLAALKRQ